MRRLLSTLDDVLLVVVVVAGGWWGATELIDRAGESPPAVEVVRGARGRPPLVQRERPPSPAEALLLLEALAVKGRAPKTGFSRDAFGPRWADADRNGCDTRNDILRRDLEPVVTRAGTHDCVVESGVLVDPYTGDRIDFVKGDRTSAAVQIDHVVALSDAWQKGAQQLDDRTRLEFANDPLNLVAVGSRPNQQKGDGDAATWLPPNTAYRCSYVARQVAVKAKYDLWVTPAERDQIARILDACTPAAAAA